MATIGFLHTGKKASFQKPYAAFVSRLRDLTPNEDIKIVESWWGDEPEKTKLQACAEDLVKKKMAGKGVKVIVAAGGPPSALVAKKAAGGVPVVFTSVADPVGLKLVSSLDSPGGNVTGIAGLTSELDVPRLELLRELLSGGKRAKIGVLNNKERPNLKAQFAKLKAAAPGLKFTLVPKDVGDLAEIDAAFDELKREKVDGVLVTADSLFNNVRDKIVKLTNGIPTIYQWREFAEAGGLISYGPSIIEAYEQAAEYVDQILDGEKPSNLPVALPNKFELVINLRVAQKDGVTIPASLLSRASFVHNPVRKRRRSSGR